MADTLDLFTGILLTVIGLVLVYGSIVYRLIDLILIIGVLITLFGLYKLLSTFIFRLLNANRSRSRKKLNNRSNDPLSRVMESAKEVEDLVNSKLDSSSQSGNALKNKGSRGNLESSTTLDEYLSKKPSKEPALRMDTPIDESKQVLKTKPAKEENPKFKLPSIRKSNKPKKRSFGYLKEDQKESSPDKVYFTPNYEKPMKVTRRPRKKTEKIDLSNAPRRSLEISKALASVGDAETIYDNEVSDESYSLIPKTIDEEIIMPIDEIDLSEDLPEEPIFNLSQSENTLYNNVIYDDSGYDGVITPIYADEVYKEEHGIRDEDINQEYEESSTYLANEMDSDYSQRERDNLETEETLDYITPNVTAEGLPRPTSVASTNPIASKKDAVSDLSRPHRKSGVASPKPRPKAETAIPRPVPKAQASGDAIPLKDHSLADAAEVPAIENTAESISIDDISEIPAIEETETAIPISEIAGSQEDTIKIDLNDPESLPIPKLLNSYVICEKGILTSQEAFEEVASHSKEEILLEAPTIKDMGDRFLSSLSKIKSRVIIEEFDLEDISYVLLLSSLIKKGVEIKTLASIDSFNLIGDTSHALLISNSIDEDDFEYGAVYDDKESVENIKELFESSWNLANDLDIGALAENS